MAPSSGTNWPIKIPTHQHYTTAHDGGNGPAKEAANEGKAEGRNGGSALYIGNEKEEVGYRGPAIYLADGGES